MSDQAGAGGVRHEPSGYRCPFCLLQQGVFDERNQPADVVGVTDVARGSRRSGGRPTLVACW